MAVDPDDAVTRFEEANRKALWYSRSRFLWTWLALGLLALATGILFLVAEHQGDVDNDQTKDIAELASDKATKAQKSTNQVVSFLRGEQGIPGVPGADGEDGTPGQPGSAGTSKPGPRGPAGEAGPPGPIGPAGPPGDSLTATGVLGEQGPAGPAGAKGDPGPEGPRGETGARGAAGADGADGAAGTAGPAGPAGPPTTFQTVFATSASNAVTPKSQNATCPAGARLVGGGFSLDPATGRRVTVSLPLGTAVWNVQAENDGGVGNWSLTAWVVCTNP